MTLDLSEARDAAVQAVTALLRGAQDLAGRILGEHDGQLVAFVLADLAATLHTRWAAESGFDRAGRDEAWVQVLAEFEAWRVEMGEQR